MKNLQVGEGSGRDYLRLWLCNRREIDLDRRLGSMVAAHPCILPAPLHYRQLQDQVTASGGGGAYHAQVTGVCLTFCCWQDLLSCILLFACKWFQNANNLLQIVNVTTIAFLNKMGEPTPRSCPISVDICISLRGRTSKQIRSHDI